MLGSRAKGGILNAPARPCPQGRLMGGIAVLAGLARNAPLTGRDASEGRWPKYFLGQAGIIRCRTVSNQDR